MKFLTIFFILTISVYSLGVRECAFNEQVEIFDISRFTSNDNAGVITTCSGLYLDETGHGFRQCSEVISRTISYSAGFEGDHRYRTGFISVVELFKKRCKRCDEPDEIYFVDPILIQKPFSQSCNDDPNFAAQQLQGCTAAGGIFHAISKTDCCIVSTCFVNPNDTCEDGFAKNTLNFCMLDSDRDGLPDSEDSTPLGSCDLPCGRENGICADTFNDFVNDWEHSISWTDCSTCETLSGDYLGVCPTLVLPPDSEECSYPSTYETLPFQTITTASNCDVLISNSNQLFGSSFPLVNCSLGEVACYFRSPEDNPDSSEGDDFDSPEDNPDSPEDDNASSLGTFDILNSLDIINDSINLQTDTLDNSLNDIISSIDNSSIINSRGLLDIVNAINSKEVTPATDMSGTNELLGDIKDGLNPDISFDNSEIDSAFSNAKNIFSNALVSFQDSHADITSLLSGSSVPTVSASGSCVLTGSTRNIGSFSFDFSHLQSLRPSFQFIFNLFLMFFTIKLYTRIIRDLMHYMTGV